MQQRGGPAKTRPYTHMCYRAESGCSTSMNVGTSRAELQNRGTRESCPLERGRG